MLLDFTDSAMYHALQKSPTRNKNKRKVTILGAWRDKLLNSNTATILSFTVYCNDINIYGKFSIFISAALFPDCKAKKPIQEIENAARVAIN